MTAPRVLVVDDSAFARTVLSKLLRQNGDISVVGTARDGADALERIDALDPDVVTLDLTMPGIDGIGVLHALRARPRPRVIVVSTSSVDAALGAQALALGAVDLVTKPTALASDRLHEIGAELRAKVIACARPAPADPPERRTEAGVPRKGADLVMIGTSTGGPQALTRLVAALPADLRAPVVMALHIPVGYTEAIAQRLDKISPLMVMEAADGLELVPGLAVLARGGMHLRVERHGSRLYAVLSPRPARQFTPSVDELFISGARAVGARSLGVVLTGMGDDGLEGARAIAAAGGMLITESASSCVIYGMPRSVYEAGLGAVSVHLDQIGRRIEEYV
ncbi:MAG TPA: chemotaxis-specific protein-glutamate methyltransferase CheB [Kofleriaceae bacterium]|nr:chemotaxis-specific protein-glutamate methyltransferase CheB [Kofleriaceae bacterium]